MNEPRDFKTRGPTRTGLRIDTTYRLQRPQPILFRFTNDSITVFETMIRRRFNVVGR